ncbi:GntG family PLP-dependent aldolase [Paenibacillus sp. GP183]|uniref:threonine aldolase family protein n=1 Tax=Paenibacillus sp. GP183 TaxID=1882751 RepID=UPI000895EE4A|nr:GntG family PLP-dependent aldolase [Paenibacillus sp. GP183]SEC83039.1 L-threonine aldolase [Paenibacillus sp. GP183]
MSLLDLRSDTVSLPTDEMLRSIYSAKLGDDILGEDPTVQELEELGSNIFGKEAGMLTVSGTMSNQIAVMVSTQRGQEVILGKESHMYNLENAALAALSQVQVRTIPSETGYFDPYEIEKAIQTPNIQTTSTGLICLENTYNLNQGLVMTVDNIREISKIAIKYGIPTFMDGARIFNAAEASGIDVKEIVDSVDAVQVCLTKGLAAPLGSLLLGTKSFIKEARRVRQRLGGGMRQAGIIAAPGIIALNKMRFRLWEDHEHARLLAEGLKNLHEHLVDLQKVQTNIVCVDITPFGIESDEFLRRMLEQGIKLKKIGPQQFRMVLYYQISKTDIERIIESFKIALQL